MRILKMLLTMVAVLSLAGCGLGGSSATPTPAATATAAATATTAAAAPTTAPAATATTAAQPTEEPEATETSGGGTSGGTGGIPAPPNSTTYTKGSDPIIDAAVGGMEESFANQGDVQFENMEFYLAESTIEDVEAFYDDEMPGLGWTGPKQSQTQEFGHVLVYPGEGTPLRAALIGMLDLSSFGQEGLLIFTAEGSEGSGGSSRPTAGPEATETSGGGTTDPAGETGLPAPPDSEPYVKGADATTDIFMDSFNESFLGGFEGTGMSVVGSESFISQASGEEIKAFYDEEMEKLGWAATPSGDTAQAGAQILNYTKTDGGSIQVAVVAAVDQSSFGGSGQIVVVAVVAQQ